jgi:hypothetical protein
MRGKPILARGRLVDKCRNLLHKCGDTVICRKRKLETKPATSVSGETRMLTGIKNT